MGLSLPQGWNVDTFGTTKHQWIVPILRSVSPIQRPNKTLFLFFLFLSGDFLFNTLHLFFFFFLSWPHAFVDRQHMTKTCRTSCLKRARCPFSSNASSDGYFDHPLYDPWYDYHYDFFLTNKKFTGLFWNLNIMSSTILNVNL